MSRPWTAERVVDEALAAQLVEHRFPELAPAGVAPFGVGWDNTAYLVNGTFVFRFPRRQLAVGLLENEVRVLPAIATRLPLAVPVPTHVGQPALGYPWPFAGYRLLEGRTACRARLSDAQRARAAAPLGAFLAALHALDPAPLAAPPDELERADMQKRAPLVQERLALLEEEGVLDDASPWRRLLDETPPPPPARDLRLVHGDLYARHVLVDDDGLPSGVIDWGDVHVGDPGVDLAIAHAFLPATARRAFLEAYGLVDERTWTLARLRALFSAVAVVWYGNDIGDAALLDEGRKGMSLVLEDTPLPG